MKVMWIIIGLEYLYEYYVKMEFIWMLYEKRDYMNVICKKYLKLYEKSVYINVIGRERI